MVVQNKRHIKFWSIIAISTMSVTLSTLFFVHLLNYNKMTLVPILFVLSFDILILFKLSYFEYEHSGTIITLRKSSFWASNKIQRPVEFPIHKLLDYSVSKNLFFVKIEMILKSEKRGHVKIRYKLLGLSDYKTDLIQKSLKTIIKENKK